MWRTTYHEPCKPVRVLADGCFSDCIIKFVQVMFVLSDGAMAGHVELHYDGGLALRYVETCPCGSSSSLCFSHRSGQCCVRCIHGVSSEPMPTEPMVPHIGGFTPRTVPSNPSVARLTGRSRKRR